MPFRLKMNELLVIENAEKKFWSNRWEWGQLSLADMYFEYEREQMALPMGGKWVYLSEVINIMEMENR